MELGSVSRRLVASHQRVWSLATGETVRVLEGHTAYIDAVALTADGMRAVSASSDNTVRVWNIETGEAVRVLQGHTELAQFREWFLEFEADAWDRQMEQDAKAGKLDALANKALDDHKAGRTTPL